MAARISRLSRIQFGESVLPAGALITAILPAPVEEAPTGEQIVFGTVVKSCRKAGAVTYTTKEGYLVPSQMVYGFAIGEWPLSFERINQALRTH